MKRQNCWEYRKCGREPNGRKVAELGVCPASADRTYNGINAGKNGGRICWAVAGTFCDEKRQGSFIEKRASCMDCPFFKLVQADEGSGKADTKFLKFISSEDRNPVFQKMGYRIIPAGERFVTQGEMEDMAYIIQHGSCLAIVEKEGELHPVNHYGEGDIVGGLGILTGEPRRAHVEAETEMKVWVLSKSQFDEISKTDPEIQDFLTEIVADRFDSKRPTAYRTIGKYVMTDIIGRGGYSIVYTGIHSSLKMPVAIKMMRHHMAMDPEFLSGFLNEARTIASLDHENIVKVYDIEEGFKTVFIVMELIRGEALDVMIKRLYKLPPYLVAYYLVQICSGMTYAHKKGIVHRDLNPTNIIVQNDDRVKIIDFGLACLKGTELSHSIGTLFYNSPEQINGTAVDQRSDIYQLGITAYEMVTGKRPFPEDNLWKLRKMHLSQEIPDPTELVPDLPEELRKFIIKASRLDPEERYRDFNQALFDLRPFVEEHLADHKRLPIKIQKMTNIILMYSDDQKLELSRLMDDFSTRAAKIGVLLQVANFNEI
ncbi:MAG: serine/threonine protein kinase [Desulfobacterium sp.]|nr:serine/threonine protein kinase [Desulfobacterium sp.]